MKKNFLLFALIAGLLGIPKSYSQATEPYVGQIIAVGFNFAPQGWAKCEGQLLPIAQYTDLFSLLGTTYGGDGQTNFALPDLRGKVLIAPGQAPGLSEYSQGQTGGSATTTLTPDNIAQHFHTIRAATTPGNLSDPTNNIIGNTSTLDKEFSDFPFPNSTMYPTALTGSSTPTPVNNMQPYLSMTYIIALQGVFPPHP